ncbi:hypothetical protein HAINFHK1212_1146 [Haemophilus influenzae HK1212]|uniref:Uncharacterized protein n=1 Tax=Haemophilus influenzae HK1212 TaxID=456482 RepID=A0A7G2JZ94_HAEIF|nr:hypothetical protein HAINFHK1212_1146 [Haemophilus influenzae HK1212]
MFPTPKSFLGTENRSPYRFSAKALLDSISIDNASRVNVKDGLPLAEAIPPPPPAETWLSVVAAAFPWLLANSETTSNRCVALFQITLKTLFINSFS